MRKSSQPQVVCQMVVYSAKSEEKLSSRMVKLLSLWTSVPSRRGVKQSALTRGVWTNDPRQEIEASRILLGDPPSRSPLWSMSSEDMPRRLSGTWRQR